MYTIAFSNEKGGVAKTTTTVSLGACLAEAGRNVLVVDLDPQANLTLALGVEPTRVTHSAASILMHGLPLHQAILHSSVSNLDLIPGSSETSQSERYLPVRERYEYLLRDAVQQAALPYDFVLMDCPPALGAVTLNALVASNLLLIPTQAEFFSIYALKNLMNWVRRIRSEYNPHLTYRLLLTLFDRRNRIHRLLSEQLRSNFNNGVLETVIEVDTKLRESPITGAPIIFHAPKSRAAAQYRALAQEIIAYVEKANLQPA